MDLQGKTVVVTGGSSGIGRAAALVLAARGAEVIVIGRDEAKGAATESALKGASGGMGAFLKADLSLVFEARRTVSELSRRFRKIDAFIQSAGAIHLDELKTSEGLDRMFVTNFLHKVVLAEGLAPLLTRAGGRMVLVATVADETTIDWSNFQGARVYAGVLAMLQLHGASLAMAQWFADDWKPHGIEVTAINPGQVDTGILRSFKGPWKWVAPFRSLWLAPVEEPAQLLCWLAFSPEARGLSGNFFPSARTYGKRRALARDAQTLNRVYETARSVIASV